VEVRRLSAVPRLPELLDWTEPQAVKPMKKARAAKGTTATQTFCPNQVNRSRNT
jgi:hypothetical protein